MSTMKSLSLAVALVVVSLAVAHAAPEGNPQLDADRQNPNFVARVGDDVWTKERMTAELGYLPPAFLQQLKAQEAAVRNYAVAWMHTQVYAKAAETDGFLARVPGLADAARYDGGRRMIAQEYVRQTMHVEKKADDKELKQFYELNKAACRRPSGYRYAQIFFEFPVRASPGEIEGARARAMEAQKRLAAGEDFAVVENTTSDRPAKAPGGEVGWVTESELGSEAVAKAVKSLEPGGVTKEPLRVERGFEIVKLIEKMDARDLTFEECRPILETRFAERFAKLSSDEKVSELMKRLGAWMNVDNFVIAFRAVKPQLPVDDASAGGPAQGSPVAP